MKKLVIFVMGLVFSSAVFASAGLCGGASHRISLESGSGGLPWPWGLEVKINLQDIEGVWATSDGACQDWFSFDVQLTSSGDKIVRIIQYNPDACVVVAQGVGYQSDRYIYAQMVNKATGRSYNLTVHAFNQSDVFTSYSRDNRLQAGSDNVLMALSLFPVGQSDKRSAYQISRLQLASEPVCR